MNLYRDLSDKREDYSKFELSESDVFENPMEQFDFWYQEAESEIFEEVNAMVLSTADLQGSVSSRMVLLKKYSEEGFLFFTNLESRKGQQLAINPKVSLLFYWGAHQRQVRIEGLAQEISSELSDSYFYSRPLNSQISAIVSPQSEEVPNRQFLEVLAEEEKLKNEHKRPLNWGGLLIVPIYFEFWQGRFNRLHDRIAYSKHLNEWIIHRLAP
jgi:pyridoxamine-phosphate oxidase